MRFKTKLVHSATDEGPEGFYILSTMLGEFVSPKTFRCSDVVTLDEVQAIEAERDALADFIRRCGYVRCDIPACNCNSFHRGLAEMRLSELREALGERVNGQTILTAVEKLISVDEQYEARATDTAEIQQRHEALRRAVEPFAKIAKLIPRMDDDTMAKPEQWRALAAAFAEDERKENDDANTV